MIVQIHVTCSFEMLQAKVKRQKSNESTKNWPTSGQSSKVNYKCIAKYSQTSLSGTRQTSRYPSIQNIEGKIL